MASGLTLRAVVPLDSQQLLVFAAHTPVGRGSTVRRVHLQDPALPRLLERGGAVADFGWDKQGLVLSVGRMEEGNRCFPKIFVKAMLRNGA